MRPHYCFPKKPNRAMCLAYETFVSKQTPTLPGGQSDRIVVSHRPGLTIHGERHPAPFKKNSAGAYY